MEWFVTYFLMPLLLPLFAFIVLGQIAGVKPDAALGFVLGLVKAVAEVIVQFLKLLAAIAKPVQYTLKDWLDRIERSRREKKPKPSPRPRLLLQDEPVVDVEVLEFPERDRTGAGSDSSRK